MRQAALRIGLALSDVDCEQFAEFKNRYLEAVKIVQIPSSDSASASASASASTPSLQNEKESGKDNENDSNDESETDIVLTEELDDNTLLRFLAADRRGGECVASADLSSLFD